MPGGYVCFADLSSSQRERSESERGDGGRDREKECVIPESPEEKYKANIFTSELDLFKTNQLVSGTGPS